MATRQRWADYGEQSKRNRLRYQKEYKRVMAARWREAGLCPNDGNERGRFVFCMKCRRRNAKASKRYRKRKRRTA